VTKNDSSAQAWWNEYERKERPVLNIRGRNDQSLNDYSFLFFVCFFFGFFVVVVVVDNVLELACTSLLHSQSHLKS